jgi:hypothetical protein
VISKTNTTISEIDNGHFYDLTHACSTYFRKHLQIMQPYYLIRAKIKFQLFKITLMKATRLPPSIRILVDQYQSSGLLSGGRILPSNWKLPLDPDPPPSSILTSVLGSDSLEANVRKSKKQHKNEKCFILLL